MDNGIADQASPRRLTIVSLSRMVGGGVVGQASEDMVIVGTCAIDAYVTNKLSFVKNTRYAEYLASLTGAVVLIPESLGSVCEEYPQNVYIVVADLTKALMDIQDYFYSSRPGETGEGVSRTARVEPTAVIDGRAYVADFVYVGDRAVIGSGAKIMQGCSIMEDASIGRNTMLYPSVYVHGGCRIGDECVVLPGARIGTDGFRFEQDFESKTVRKMYHAGRVVVGDRVEIGANCTIDRATFEDEATLISDDVKLNNLVHVAHNSRIGARTIVGARSGIAGTSRIGEDVWIGIGATISNGVNVGNRAKVLLNAVVAYDVAEGEIVSGFYAMPHRQWKRVCSRLREM